MSLAEWLGFVQEERKRGREIQALENRISSKPLPLPETREAQQARVKSSFKFFDTHESMKKRSEKYEVFE